MAAEKKAIIHCCVEREVYDMLMDHCEKTGQTKTMAIRRAIQHYCGEHEIKPASGGDAGRDDADI